MSEENPAALAAALQSRKNAAGRAHVPRSLASQGENMRGQNRPDPRRAPLANGERPCLFAVKTILCQGRSAAIARKDRPGLTKNRLDLTRRTRMRTGPAFAHHAHPRSSQGRPRKGESAEAEATILSFCTSAKGGQRTRHGTADDVPAAMRNHFPLSLSPPTPPPPGVFRPQGRAHALPFENGDTCECRLSVFIPPTNYEWARKYEYLRSYAFEHYGVCSLWSVVYLFCECCR
jgi:hypothetical protein